MAVDVGYIRLTEIRTDRKYLPIFLQDNYN
jgi:hypothetical protein